MRVELAWTARPSTTPRRQGRRGRSVDFAQWYPKVAVYDRDGWKPNALVPAGEFHGEYGTFDVTMIVADDQVLGATGVPVGGDPGWARAAAPGQSVFTHARAYDDVPEGPTFKLAGRTAGGALLRPRRAPLRLERLAGLPLRGRRATCAPGRRAPTAFPCGIRWPVHVLYRGDAETDCAPSSRPRPPRGARPRVGAAASRPRAPSGRTDARSPFGLATLRLARSRCSGRIRIRRLTILKRLDGGGTEFPMMMQNGSASQGLTTHEGGHIYAYGILGSNEWQSGWMDEGLTSYQTSMQTGSTRAAVSAAVAALNLREPDTHSATRRWPRRRSRSATRCGAAQRGGDRDGDAEPIGTRADLFRDFATYNGMVYGRAAAMYEALHDAIGDARVPRLPARLLCALGHSATWTAGPCRRAPSG